MAGRESILTRTIQIGGSRATAMIGDRHAARLIFHRAGEPSADSAWADSICASLMMLSRSADSVRWQGGLPPGAAWVAARPGVAVGSGGDGVHRADTRACTPARTRHRVPCHARNAEHRTARIAAIGLPRNFRVTAWCVNRMPLKLLYNQAVRGQFRTSPSRYGTRPGSTRESTKWCLLGN